MLFDLRSPHRRRVIKVVYVFLAVLIGGGLIFFGVGNGSNFGGLLTAAGNGGGGSATGSLQYTRALAKAEKLAKASPNNAQLWLKTGEAAYAVATLPSNYDASLGFTATGHVALNKLRTAWVNYLNAAPSNPSFAFAQEVVAGFGAPPRGVGDYRTDESAQEILAQDQPSSVTYEYLAYYAWLSGAVTTGNDAAIKAAKLASKSSAKQVYTTLAEMLAVAKATSGATGATAPIAPASPTAATGATGTTAPAPAPKSTGAKGATGAKGSAGAKGATGATGG